MDAFLDGKRLTGKQAIHRDGSVAKYPVYNRLQEATSHLHEDGAEETIPQSLNVVDHFVALLLAILIESGLIGALVAIIEDPKEATLSRKATLLLGEVLQLSNRILPLQYAAQLQASLAAAEN